ncbi:aldo/keto reductase [Kineosporia sp. NBRC 101731]|uniref:aldo/keto reductase n=1 Tax=Kineosporia sp. NBRC 101731 TaxID=3032199 RepID=UPI00249FB81A|nr:aldo/keto reductase [Kineosporia sp. NBRC 101731]GLY32256.1 2,5-diketo-D-gluconic acid reductase [Kineosporia sp. NBRC 101731]
MSSLTEYFTLSNDVQIHKLGFGTWQIPDGDDTYNSVTTALKLGYRHIDTARAYENEASVGRAVRDSGIPREEVFITTKLPAEVKDYDQARATFEESSSLLDLGHVDLYLIHAPWPWAEQGKDYSEGNIAVWTAMEELYDAGRVRSIGVSNFNVADLESLTASTRIRPQVNQIRWFIGNTQDETTAYCEANDILVEGYSPLATGAILDNPQVRKIAEQYGKTVAQVCIRYLLEKDVLPLPKSTTPSRIAENADVDFVLKPEDVTFLDGLTDTTA